MAFLPTTLYVKEHIDTGLKYFGKTTVYTPHTIDLYFGSGKYWKNHLKVHGKNVITLWSKIFYDEREMTEYALKFSDENNIVNQLNEDGKKVWANLRPESGREGSTKGFGGIKGRSSSKKGKPANYSDDVLYACGSPWRGKKQPTEMIKNRSEKLRKVKRTVEWVDKIRESVIETYKNPTDAMLGKYIKISQKNKEWGWITNGLDNKKVKKVDIDIILSEDTAWSRGRTILHKEYNV